MEKILAKCEYADLEYLSSVLDSYVSFTDDAARKSYGDFWCMGDIEKVAYPAD